MTFVGPEIYEQIMLSIHEGTHEGCPYGGLGWVTRFGGAGQGTHKGCPYGRGFKGFGLRFL